MAGPIRIAILANAAQARREVRSFSRELNDFKKHLKPIENLGASVENFTRGASKATLITTALVAALASIGAVSGPILALGGGVAAAMGAAGIGVAAFTALAVPAFAKVGGAVSEVTKAQEAYDAALAAGDQEAATKALEARAAALKDLNPVQREAVLGTLELKDAFKQASDQFADPSLRVYTRGLETLKGLIPTLLMIATPVQTALVEQFERLFASLESPAFDRFAARLATHVGPIISTTGDLVADLGMTIGHLIDAALPVSNQLLSIFGSLFAELREASSGSGLASWFEEMVPLAQKLADFISALVGAFGDLVVATMPLGGPLLSMLEGLSASLSKLFQSQQFATFVTALGSAFAALSPVLDTLLMAIGSVAAVIASALGPTITALTPFITEFAATFAKVLAGISPLLPVLGQLVSAVGAALLPAIGKLVPAIAAALIPVVLELGKQLPQLAPAFLRIVDAIIPLLPLIADILIQVVPLIPKVIELVAALVEWYASTGNIQAALKILGEVVSAVVQVISGAIDVVVGILTGDWSRAWNGAKTLVEGQMKLAVAAVKFAIEQVVGLLSTFIPGVRANFQRAWDAARQITVQTWANIKAAISSGVAAAIRFVAELPARIRGLFASAASWLLDAGRRIIDGLLAGIRSAIGRVQSLLSSVTSMIPQWKGPPGRDSRLLYGAGQLIIGGLVNALAAGKQSVRSELSDITDLIEGGLNGITSPTITPRMSLAGVHGDLSYQGSPGGNVYHVNVSVPVGASLADAGREIVKCIEEFERSGGRRRAA